MFSKLTNWYVGSWGARIAAALVVLVGVVLFTFLMPTLLPYRVDIDVYRIGGELILRGGDLYQNFPLTEIKVPLPFTYPPTAAIMFVGFAFVPLGVASVGIVLVSYALLGWVFYLIIRQLTGRNREQSIWLAVLASAAAVWTGPVAENTEFGQVNILLMTLVIADLMLGRGKRWSGWLIGLAVAIKLTPAVFIMYFLLRKDWRGVIGIFSSFATYTALGFVIRPHDSITYWTSVLFNTNRIGAPGFASNQSIWGFMARIPFESRLVWFLVAGAVGLGISWAAWQLIRLGENLAAAIVIGFIALLCSPVSWGHHWVWALALLVLLAVWAARQGPMWGLWAGLGAAGYYILWIRPQWIFPWKLDARPDWNFGQQLVGSGYLLWAICSLVAIGWYAYQQRRNTLKEADALLEAEAVTQHS